MNQDKIEKIRLLLSEGKKKTEVARELGISPSTVFIYSSDENMRKHKEKLNSPEEKAKRKAYIREYMKKRYHSDEEFRKKIRNNQEKYRLQKRGEKVEDN